MEPHLVELLKLPNLTSIVLSFDKNNIKNYSHITKYLGQDKVTSSYTGMPTEFEALTESFSIFFNVSDKKADKLYTRKFKEQCPCDSGVLVSAEACSHCNKCWRSSVTKPKGWSI
jgi:hypothetical protein